jgi:hypothetical protein
MELFKRRLFGLDTSKNFLCHPLEGFVFLFFTVFVGFYVLLLSWVDTCIKESLKVLLEGFFPEE